VNRSVVRLAGSGGQGVVLGSVLLAEAALRQGKWAACFHAFGPEARGGAARGDVVIADGPLDYPVSQEVDVLLALTQEAAQRHAASVRPGGVVIADTSRVREVPPGPYRAWRLPVYRSVREVLGTEAPGNVACLGVLAAVTGLVTAEALGQAVRDRFRRDGVAQNLKALEVGLRLGRELLTREEAAG